jgi:2-haloacid dehalogenase
METYIDEYDLEFCPLKVPANDTVEKYKPFSEITLNSIHQALLELSISTPTEESKLSAFDNSILDAYNSLTIFPDAKSALELLPSKKNLESYIFSNGTKAMLQSSIHESDDLKPFANLFNGIVSVEETQVFKPAPDVYRHLVKSVGKKWESNDEVAKVWLVSGNPFDVVGAKSVGMKACWVDRGGNGWTDRLMGDDEEFKPDLIVKGVKDAVEGISGWYN